MNTFDKLMTGIVGIGIITALGLHAADIANLTKSTGTASSKLMTTVEKG